MFYCGSFIEGDPCFEPVNSFFVVNCLVMPCARGFKTLFLSGNQEKIRFQDSLLFGLGLMLTIY